MTVCNRGNRAVLKAVSAVQTVLLMDDTGTSFLNRLLRADTDTFSTADTFIRNQVSLWRNFSVSNRVAFPENRIHSQIKIFDGHISYTENDADTAGVSGINVRKIRLFFKNQIPPFLPRLFRNRFYRPGQTNHLFIHGIAEHLHFFYFQEFPAEVLSSGGKKKIASGS